jgi:predicted DNA-binding protein
MSGTTTVRISKKTKAKLERVASLTGMNISKTIDFAIHAAEDKIDEYHGNVDSLLKLKPAKSGFSKTSEIVDKVLAREETER